MHKLAFAAVSRNYFNMPVWIASHQGLFADEGLLASSGISVSVTGFGMLFDGTAAS